MIFGKRYGKRRFFKMMVEILHSNHQAKFTQVQGLKFLHLVGDNDHTRPGLSNEPQNTWNISVWGGKDGLARASFTGEFVESIQPIFEKYYGKSKND